MSGESDAAEIPSEVQEAECVKVLGELEARVGIEPTHKGFADPVLALVSSFSLISLALSLSLRANFGPTP